MPEIKQPLQSWFESEALKALIPASVYRLQLNAQFTFRDAEKNLPYRQDLGVKALYFSPIFQAVPGSTHGYNVTDPNVINPELGGEAGLESLAAAASGCGMLLILDVVPNHMGINADGNLFWQDVLENGPASIYADVFDIDWEPEKRELHEKVLLPILGDHYGRVLEAQKIKLVFSAGGFCAEVYGSRHLPLAPDTYPMILETGMEDLGQRLPVDHEEHSEYCSIITAFRNLPSRLERDPLKIQERHREKEIAKSRLAKLTERSEAVRTSILSRLKVLNGTPGNPASFDALDRILNEQSFRMAFWRVAFEEINYRRFFDINDLAAIRIEQPAVFDLCHKLVFRLLLEGKVHGLRIDHPDGLYDPPAYFSRLQEQYRKLCPEAERPVYVTVEKILDRREPLPADWCVHGTVGYDFMASLDRLFVLPENAKAFDGLYEAFIGEKIDFERLVYEKKKQFALVQMPSEINSLSLRLDRISESNRRYRDFTRNNLAVAIREVIACFPVYRTYISPEADVVSERDQKYIQIAIERAKRKTPALPHALYDFLKDILLLKLAPELGHDEERRYRDFILRFQQLTGPIMAKGYEDTSFYVYNRLISLNEVGGDPVQFGSSTAEFHRQNLERSKRWPAGLLSTSTHDTKRGEDARMRIHVLSEIPDEWKTQLTRWATANDKHKTELDGTAEPKRNTEYFIYQTLLGAWPEEGLQPGNREDFIERITQYTLKSVREAKIDTNWVNPNLPYEEAVSKFIRAILSGEGENPFLNLFLPFQKQVARHGVLNSLSATLLKIMSPGVPDIYQGSELWNFSLVDPDNRRAVDYDRYQNIKADLTRAQKGGLPLSTMLEQGHCDWVKMSVTRTLLHLRGEFPDLFCGGEYFPLEVKGPREKNVVAFLRRQGERFAVVAASRFFTETLFGHEEPFLKLMDWKDTKILLPEEFKNRQELREMIKGDMMKTVTSDGVQALPCGSLFQSLNIALLM